MKMLLCEKNSFQVQAVGVNLTTAYFTLHPARNPSFITVVLDDSAPQRVLPASQGHQAPQIQTHTVNVTTFPRWNQKRHEVEGAVCPTDKVTWWERKSNWSQRCSVPWTTWFQFVLKNQICYNRGVRLELPELVTREQATCPCLDLEHGWPFEHFVAVQVRKRRGLWLNLLWPPDYKLDYIMCW